MESMPVTGLLNSNLMTNFGFKWVPKGMKYLGIKLSQVVEEMPALNFEPVLVKYLDKWGTINLTLWGKVNLIKIVISPQFNYILDEEFTGDGTSNYIPSERVP